MTERQNGRRPDQSKTSSGLLSTVKEGVIRALGGLDGQLQTVNLEDARRKAEQERRGEILRRDNGGRLTVGEKSGIITVIDTSSHVYHLDNSIYDANRHRSNGNGKAGK